MDDLSKSIFLDIFQDSNAIVITDSSFLSGSGASAFLNYLSELAEDDRIGTGMVISDKTFETLKKIVSDHETDYNLRKRASDALVSLSRLTQDKKVRIYGDAFDRTDENTVLLMQLTRLRKSYTILFLSDSPSLLRDVDMINDFGSVHGELISIGLLDESGNFVSLDDDEPSWMTDGNVESQEPIEKVTIDSKTETEDLVTCIKCGKQVPLRQTVEEVCEDCLNQIIGVTYCIDCREPIPVTFRDQYIDQNVRGRRCDDCSGRTSEDLWIGITAPSPVPEATKSENTGTVPAESDQAEAGRNLTVCSQCGRSVPSDETVEGVCPDCMNRVVEERFCIECGTKIPVTFADKYITGEIRELCPDCQRNLNTAQMAQIEPAPSWYPTAYAHEPASVQMIRCPRCHQLVSADQTSYGYCQHCLDQVISHSYCCECGTSIPLTLRESLERNGQPKLYCDHCSQTFAEEDSHLTNASMEDTVECPACHRMVSISYTDHGYCQDCLNQIVEQGFCIQCGKPVNLTFRDVYLNEGRTGLYCEECQRRKNSAYSPSAASWNQPQTPDDRTGNQSHSAASRSDAQVKPDLSGWSTL